MNPDLRHPNGYTFPAGPKAPAPIAPNWCQHWQYGREQSTRYECACGVMSTFLLPGAIAAALQERSFK